MICIVGFFLRKISVETGFEDRASSRKTLPMADCLLLTAFMFVFDLP